MRLTTTIFALLLINLAACKKDDSQSSINNCSSSIPAYQDTITVGATKYSIIAIYGAQQKLLIELLGYNGQPGVTLTVDFVEVIKGTNCYESSSSTILTGTTSAAYEFSNVPSWVNDSTASAFIKATINGNAYYLRDAMINQ